MLKYIATLNYGRKESEVVEFKFNKPIIKTDKIIIKDKPFMVFQVKHDIDKGTSYLDCDCCVPG